MKSHIHLENGISLPYYSFLKKSGTERDLFIAWTFWLAESLFGSTQAESLSGESEGRSLEDSSLSFRFSLKPDLIPVSPRKEQNLFLQLKTVYWPSALSVNNSCDNSNNSV